MIDSASLKRNGLQVNGRAVHLVDSQNVAYAIRDRDGGGCPARGRLICCLCYDPLNIVAGKSFELWKVDELCKSCAFFDLITIVAAGIISAATTGCDTRRRQCCDSIGSDF